MNTNLSMYAGPAASSYFANSSSEGSSLPTQEQMQQWKEAFDALRDSRLEYQFQLQRRRALVEDVAKLAGVRIKVLEGGE